MPLICSRTSACVLCTCLFSPCFFNVSMSASLVRSMRLWPRGRCCGFHGTWAEQRPGKCSKEWNPSVLYVIVKIFNQCPGLDGRWNEIIQKRQFCSRKCVNLGVSPVWPSTVAASSLRKRKSESEILTPQTQECSVYMGSFIWHEEKCLLVEFRKPHPTLAHTHPHTHPLKAGKTPTHKSNV